ncbi:MAG TPA: hypothetical protein DCE42_00875 [Myxococcales bacterium]|nr:hypothetical protein [Myxococcales bacterium]
MTPTRLIVLASLLLFACVGGGCGPSYQVLKQDVRLKGKTSKKPIKVKQWNPQMLVKRGGKEFVFRGVLLWERGWMYLLAYEGPVKMFSVQWGHFHLGGTILFPPLKRMFRADKLAVDLWSIFGKSKAFPKCPTPNGIRVRVQRVSKDTIKRDFRGCREKRVVVLKSRGDQPVEGSVKRGNLTIKVMLLGQPRSMQVPVETFLLKKGSSMALHCGQCSEPSNWL